jgi:hypothetical protein
MVLQGDGPAGPRGRRDDLCLGRQPPGATAGPVRCRGASGGRLDVGDAQRTVAAEERRAPSSPDRAQAIALGHEVGPIFTGVGGDLERRP